MHRANVKRVLGYVRVSGQEQGRTGTSLEAQREEIARYCATHNYPDPRIFVEVESAGAEKLERRAELRALLAEAREGDLVIAAAQDRWSRDTLFYLQSTRDLVKRGARFFSIREQFDPNTAEGRLAATMMAAVAEQERERIKARTVGRRKELRNAGHYVEGLPPIGYRRGPERRLVIVPADAEIVRDVYARCARGESIGRTAEHLQVEHPERHGWDRKTINVMLRSRIYLGEVRDARGLWMRGHEPIVDRDLWERAQAALDKRRHGGRRPTTEARTHGWLLRGLANCDACGSRLGAVYGRTTDYYGCARRLRVARGEGANCDAPYLRQKETDAAFATHVVARLRELRAELARPSGKRRAAPERDFDTKRARVTQRRQTAIRLALDGTITDADLRKQLADLDAELGRVEVEAAEHERSKRLDDARTRRGVLADIEAIERAWSRMAPPKRRAVVAKLCKSIRLLEAADPVVEWRTLEELAADRAT